MLFLILHLYFWRQGLLTKSIWLRWLAVSLTDLSVSLRHKTPILLKRDIFLINKKEMHSKETGAKGETSRNCVD